MERAALEKTLRECARGVGPLARAYEIYLERPADVEAIPAVELMRPEPLRHVATRAVKEWSDHPLDEDPRAAVSRVVRRYLGALTTAVIPALANGIGVDVAPERVSIVMRSDLPHGVVLRLDEVLVSSERPATHPVRGRDVGSLAQLRALVLGPLFAHTAWVFDQVLAYIKVSPQLLWSTAAEQVDGIFQYAVDGPEAAVFARASGDRDLMIEGEQLPGVAGPNPLRGLLYWEPASEPGHRNQVRKVCCANFVVPGRTQGYCRNCDLITPVDRLRMYDEWHASVKSGSWSG